MLNYLCYESILCKTGNFEVMIIYI